MSLLDDSETIMSESIKECLLNDELIESFGFEYYRWNGDRCKPKEWLYEHLRRFDRYSFKLIIIKRKFLVWSNILEVELRPMWSRELYDQCGYAIECRKNGIYIGYDHIKTVNELNEFCIKYLEKSIL